jgi:hypothetical protein
MYAHLYLLVSIYIFLMSTYIHTMTSNAHTVRLVDIPVDVMQHFFPYCNAATYITEENADRLEEEITLFFLLMMTCKHTQKIKFPWMLFNLEKKNRMLQQILGLI